MSKIRNGFWVLALTAVWAGGAMAVELDVSRPFCNSWVDASAWASYVDVHSGRQVYDEQAKHYTASDHNDSSAYGYAQALANADMTGFDGSRRVADSMMGMVNTVTPVWPDGGGQPSAVGGAVKFEAIGEASVDAHSSVLGRGKLQGWLTPLSDEDAPPYTSVDLYWSVTASGPNWLLRIGSEQFNGYTYGASAEGTVPALTDWMASWSFEYTDSFYCPPEHTIVGAVKEAEVTISGIPEPATMALLATAGAALLRRRR